MVIAIAAKLAEISIWRSFHKTKGPGAGEWQGILQKRGASWKWQPKSYKILAI
ncbi:hypothetical protein [Paenibacillus ihumii]|uniref:hypothetical protein n=1 Tax=Paenibacillus ihumii TaxID=687436 RepID=UPI000A6F011F|nr:hypothetical protein [Paenibacillus ihumii]